MFINTDFLKDNKIQLILEKTVDGNIMKEWVPALSSWSTAVRY